MMLEELQLRNYAQNTIRHYLRAVEDFARRFRCSPDRLGPRHIREYQAELFQKRKLSANSVRQHLAALRFFYIKTLRRAWSLAETPYPKKTRRLPTVLSREEVTQLIHAARTPGDPRTRKLLPSQESPAQSLSRQVRQRSRAGFSEWSAQLPSRPEAASKSQDLRRLAATTVSRKVGGVLEASLRWPRICAAISRPLHPSRGHLQPSPGLLCRWPSDFSLARFRSPQRTEAHRFVTRQILASLPAAYSSERLRAYPALRFPGLPTAPHDIAPMLPVVGCGTRSAYRRARFFHRRRSRSLSLSQVWRTNEGHRTAHCRRNPTSFSTTDQLCGMRLLSPTRKLWVLPGAAHLCASPSNRSLFQPLRPQSLRYFFAVANFRAHGAMCRALQHSLGM